MKKDYIYGIDILRSVALVVVVGYHFFPDFLPGGFIGVDIFFVLSGYLTLKSIFYNEENAINFSFLGLIKKRFLRLFPPMAAVILIFSAISILFSRDFNSVLEKQFFGSLTFFDNWQEILSGSSYEGNLFPHMFKNMWTLGVEFQFYIGIGILLTVIYLFFSRKNSLNIIMIFTLLLSGISSLLMIYFASKGEWSRSYFGTDSHSASLFLGAFLAILLEKIGIENFRRKLSYSAPFIIMGILYLIIYFVVLICWSLKGEYENKITFFFAIPIAAMATTIALFFILNMQVFLKSLPHSVFAIISKRSYEIYLIHVPVSTLVLMSNIKSNFSVIISFIITIVFSEIIYRLVEIPFSITYFRKKMLKNKAYITSLIMVFIITFSISIYNIITAPYISKTEKNMQENTYKMNEKIMDKLDEPVK